IGLGAVVYRAFSSFPRATARGRRWAGSARPAPTVGRCHFAASRRVLGASASPACTVCVLADAGPQRPPRPPGTIRKDHATDGNRRRAAYALPTPTHPPVSYTHLTLP